MLIPIASALSRFTCGLLLSVLHAIYCGILFTKWFRAFLNKYLYNLRSILYSRNSLYDYEYDLIKRTTRVVSKLPKHFLLAVGDETISYGALIQVILWCIPSGITVLSFYDHKDELDPEHLRDLFRAHFKEYMFKIKWGVSFEDLRKNGYSNGFTSGCSNDTSQLQVNIFLKRHGRQLLIDSVMELCDSEIELKDQADTEVALNGIMCDKLKGSGEPDFMVICGNVNTTYGFSPWHIGFTEFSIISNEFCVKMSALNFDELKVKIVTSDYYMDKPRMELNDDCYSVFRSSTIYTVPIIRIFGPTISGKKACIHVHNVYPYIFVPDEITVDLYSFATYLDEALNVSTGKRYSNGQHVYKIDRVLGIPFYGYHSNEKKFLKIYFYSPSVIKKAAEILQAGAVCNTKFQPHESHLSFLLQFFIDYNLYGMSHIRCSKYSSRLDSNDPCQNSIREEFVEKISHAEIEVDVSASDILNKAQQGGMSRNPGLAYIWEEEMRRRKVQHRCSQLTPNISQCRSKSKPTQSVVRLKQKLSERIENLLRQRNCDKDLLTNSGSIETNLENKDLEIDSDSSQKLNTQGKAIADLLESLLRKENNDGPSNVEMQTCEMNDGHTKYVKDYSSPDMIYSSSDEDSDNGVDDNEHIALSQSMIELEPQIIADNSNEESVDINISPSECCNETAEEVPNIPQFDGAHDDCDDSRNSDKKQRSKKLPIKKTLGVIRRVPSKPPIARNLRSRNKGADKGSTLADTKCQPDEDKKEDINSAEAHNLLESSPARKTNRRENLIVRSTFGETLPPTISPKRTYPKLNVVLEKSPKANIFRALRNSINSPDANFKANSCEEKPSIENTRGDALSSSNTQVRKCLIYSPACESQRGKGKKKGDNRKIRNALSYDDPLNCENQFENGRESDSQLNKLPVKKNRIVRNDIKFDYSSSKTLSFLPPTSEDAVKFVREMNYDMVKNRKPYYSDVDDYKLNKKFGGDPRLFEELEEYRSDISESITDLRQRLATERANFSQINSDNFQYDQLTSHRVVTLAPLKLPPTVDCAKKWLNGPIASKKKEVVPISNAILVKIKPARNSSSSSDDNEDSFNYSVDEYSVGNFLTHSTPSSVRNVKGERTPTSVSTNSPFRGNNFSIITSRASVSPAFLGTISTPNLASHLPIIREGYENEDPESINSENDTPENKTLEIDALENIVPEKHASEILTPENEAERIFTSENVASEIYTPENSRLKNITSLVDRFQINMPSQSRPNQSASCEILLNSNFELTDSSYNMQGAQVDSQRQYLTVMSMELFAKTRGILKPDPEIDSIEAIFYSISHDSDETPELITGMIVSRNSQPVTALRNYKCDIIESEDELSIILEFLRVLRKWDPDIVVGYEIETLSWGYLIDRGRSLDINLQEEFSRVRAKTKKNFDTFYQDAFESETKLVGRVVLNIWRLLRHELNLLSYTFENVVFHVLKQRVPRYDHEALTNFWNNYEKCGWIVIEYYLSRVELLLLVLNELDFIGRTGELASLFGIQFSEVLTRGSQFRVESLMLRMAKPENYVPVSPSVSQRAAMRAPESLPLIMEPESKFYSDPVIVLDFQSLYPSIIIAYNYCFSTCLGRYQFLGDSDSFELGCIRHSVPLELIAGIRNSVEISPCGVAFVDKSIRVGILPAMLEEILEARLLVKKSMKENKDNKLLQKVLHARQLGLKLIANVTYGYTAANFSGRMPCIEVGDSVVSKGRETLERAIKLVNDTKKWGCRVAYGDTDSLFVLVPGRTRQEAFSIGAEIAQAVTDDNPKPVKLKLEKVYQPCILQTKKRYVGAMYENADQKEWRYNAKGIETVRRDGCPAVSKILEKSLRILFETCDVSSVKKYVLKQFSKIFSGRVSIRELTFAREYRGMSGYKPGACVAALQLAKQCVIVDKRSEPRVKERVPYVIIAGHPDTTLIKLVRSPFDLLKDTSIKINAEYYITRAIIPPLDRCFSLFNVDVRAWYAEMPRKSHFYRLYSNENSVTKKSTLSQYFPMANCVVCEAVTSREGVCNECVENRGALALAIARYQNRWESKYNYLRQICRSCSEHFSAVDYCYSLDCPVLYRRHQSAQDLNQTRWLQSIEKSFLR